MLERTGVPTEAQLVEVAPSGARLAKGPVAVIECFQRIPCDPCAWACPTGAIAPFADINDLPTLDAEACTGCGACIAACPGLAIFVVDVSRPGDTGMVRVPYEFLPVPAAGEEVAALDREGRVVGRAKVQRVQAGAAQDKTLVVWLEVPTPLAMRVRGLKAGERHG